MKQSEDPTGGKALFPQVHQPGIYCYTVEAWVVELTRSHPDRSRSREIPPL